MNKGVKEEEIKIEKMVLKIDDEKVSLSMEQAKKLKKILDELFGKEVIKEVEHHHYRDWYYRPYWGTSSPLGGSMLYDSSSVFSNAVKCSNSTLSINLEGE